MGIHKSLLAAGSIVVALLAGCAADDAQDQGERAHQRSDALAVAIPADADLTVAPEGRVSFAVITDETGAQVWTDRVDAPVFAGGKVSVSVTRERFPSCGIGGEVTVFVRTKDGTILEAGLAQGDAESARYGSFDMPAGVTSAELWLRSTTSDGCVEWDSDFERNYPLDVYDWAPALLQFGADWSRTQTALPAGGAVVIDYDFARLPDCRVNYHGYPSWDILAHARFDDGPVVDQSMVTLGYTSNGVPDGTVNANLVVMPIRRDARFVAFWFENTQYPPTCQGWDSDFGSNYVYAIVKQGVKPGPTGLNCAAGGLDVTRDDNTSAEEPVYTAVVSDQAAIDYFVARSQESHDETANAYGGGETTVHVQSYLPYNMVIEGDGAARRLRVTELRESAAGGFAAGQFLGNLEPDGSGLTLTATNMTMPSSHTVVQWELGRYAFGGCAGK